MSDNSAALSTYRYTIDKKNRLFIPSKYRNSLGDSLIIAPDFRNHALIIYSKEEFALANEKLKTLKGERKEIALHVLNSSSDTYEPDEQGRITLNGDLVKYARLSGPVVIEGMGSQARIWNAELYSQKYPDEFDPELLISLADEADLL